jgi:Phage Mu protein F like protein
MPTAEIDYSRITFPEALDYLAAKTNLDTDSYIEGQGIVQDVAFTVAAAKGQLLQDIRDAMDRSISNGESINKFLVRFNNIAASYTDDWPLKGGNSWRGALIYQQNIRQAYNAGRYQQMTDPDVMKLRPYWQWKHGNSEAPRLTHLALDGKVFRADSLPFHPPMGFNCSCSVYSLSQRDVDRKGLEVEDLSIGQDLEVVDPSNGQTRTVILQPDKGFDRIPGKSTPEQRAELIKRLDPELQQLVQAESSSEEARFARIPEGTVRRLGGTNFVLRNSRWHKYEDQEAEQDKLASHVRAEAIGNLVDSFEQQLKARSATSTDSEADRLIRRDESIAIGRKLIHGLMSLNSRDAAEHWASKIDMGSLSPELHKQALRNAADFYQLIGNDLGIESIKPEASRSYAKDSDRSIGLVEDTVGKTRRVQFHEMGHFTEFDDPETKSMASDFIRSRATGVPRSLAEMTGIGYGEGEVAYPDKFVDPYVGKVYSDGCTEVHSMGLEMFSNGYSVTKLYDRDPEHFHKMIRYIRSGRPTI